MKRIYFMICAGMFLIGASSCKKYLDVNTNPNSPTSSTPDLVLPQALVYTAAQMNSFNNYGAQVSGAMVNAGGYGGFGVVWTYQYGPGDNGGLWNTSYDIANDFQYVINSTAGNDTYVKYNAVARIMRSFIFQWIVDQYSDVPYSEALQGSAVVTPKYQPGKDIYPMLANQLDSAIAMINANPLALDLTASTDPLFAGNMTKWKQFANTIKLRLIVRGTPAATFANTTFSADGFLTADAVVNPKYERSSGRQNPAWNNWVTTYTNSAATRSYIPSKFMHGFYDGNKLKDDARGRAIYLDYPNTAVNQLGVETATLVPKAPAATNAWYSGTTASLPAAAGLGNNIGIMKGPDMGEPLMLAAESYFLQAEAAVRGILTSVTAKTAFNNGITASFTYLYKLPNGSVKSGYSASDSAAAYIANNSSSPLVNFDQASTNEQKIEAIITQKYIANNFINSIENWNEYRRTGYPRSGNPLTSPYESFASTQSASTSRPDRLPTRLQYPSSEFSYNPDNVPSGINVLTSLIFWAK